MLSRDSEKARRFADTLGRELNHQQLSAVTAEESRVLVLAGAGTGKTQVITYRVAFLLWMGVKPSEILLATFTNKAAHMMLSRVETITGRTSHEILGGTFHHIANFFLRRYGQLIGLSRSYSIADEDDSERLVKQARKELLGEAKEKGRPTASTIHKIGSLAKNSRKNIEQVIDERFEELRSELFFVRSVLELYEEKKQNHRILDFDDLLVFFLRLLENAEFERLVARRFKHVLVDEFQDTNSLQVEIIDRLVSYGASLFVVGDEAQSIYTFRAADYRNLVSLPERYPNIKVYKLETNYRSTPEILALANDIIKDTPEPFLKRLSAVKGRGELPKVIICNDLVEQAEFIAQHTLYLVQSGLRLSDIGVLYRSHRNSLEIEVELSSAGIPYDIRGGARFMERAHVKDVLAPIVLLANPKDTIAFSRLMEMCDGIGKKTTQSILQQIAGAQEPLKLFIRDEKAFPLRGKAKESVQALRSILGKMSDLRDAGASVSTLLDTFHREFYAEKMKQLWEDAEEREGDIMQLVNFSERFDSLESFLSEAALDQAWTRHQIAEEQSANAKDRLTLSTIHQAKGLEWRAVFVASLYDGNLPHRMSFGSLELLEEERRLFYVAVTRAKELLFLTVPQSENGEEYYSFTRPSRYLRMLSDGLFEEFTVVSDEE